MVYDIKWGKEKKTGEGPLWGTISTALLTLVRKAAVTFGEQKSHRLRNKSEVESTGSESFKINRT